MEFLFQQRLIADGQRKLTIRVPIKHFLKNNLRGCTESAAPPVFPVAHAILIRSEHHVVDRLKMAGAKALGHYANVSTVWSRSLTRRFETFQRHLSEVDFFPAAGPKTRTAMKRLSPPLPARGTRVGVSPKRLSVILIPPAALLGDHPLPDAGVFRYSRHAG
jgi:hypothetical protein